MERRDVAPQPGRGAAHRQRTATAVVGAAPHRPDTRRLRRAWGRAVPRLSWSPPMISDSSRTAVAWTSPDVPPPCATSRYAGRLREA